MPHATASSENVSVPVRLRAATEDLRPQPHQVHPVDGASLGQSGVARGVGVNRRSSAAALGKQSGATGVALSLAGVRATVPRLRDLADQRLWQADPARRRSAGRRYGQLEAMACHKVALKRIETM